MKTGIYYNDITRKVMSGIHCTLVYEARLTDEQQLGLLAVRGIPVDRGPVDDGAVVCWHLPQPEEARSPPLPCDVRGIRQSAPGWLGSLSELLRGARQAGLVACYVQVQARGLLAARNGAK